MFIAEYVLDGKLIRVYSENGRKNVTCEEYVPGKMPLLVKSGYIPWKREKDYGKKEGRKTDEKDPH